MLFRSLVHFPVRLIPRSVDKKEEANSNMQFVDCENVLFTKPSGRVSLSSHLAVSMWACESLSSPEPSPIKLEGPGFHVHKRRTLPVLVASYVLWSAILTFLASTALI